MVFKYCPTCGLKLDTKNIKDEGVIPYCQSCDKLYFPSSTFCILALVINQLNQVVLIKQKEVSDSYILVAGYIKEKETIKDAAIREIKEELNLNVVESKILNSYYYPKKDLQMVGIICKVDHLNYQLSDEVNSLIVVDLFKSLEYLRDTSVAKILVNDYIKSLNQS